MTHSAPSPRTSAKTILALILSGFLGAAGDHVWVVLEVKDRVDAMRAEQIENTKWRIESQTRIKQIEESHQALVVGQYYINKRLCVLLIEHGAADKECRAMLYNGDAPK